MERNQAILESVRGTKAAAPCVSIYMNKPVNPLSEKVASIALYQELSYARMLLERSFSKQTAADYVKPILLVAKDELLNVRPGTLALFHSGDISSCVRLDGAVPSQTVVADSFHVKPLVKLQQTPDAEALKRALARCRVHLNEGRAVTELFHVAQALRSGKVHCLWVAEDVTLWGILNRKHGTIVLHPKQMNERDGDVLDDLLEMALDQGVEVQILPLHQMPSQHAIIAEL